MGILGFTKFFGPVICKKSVDDDYTEKIVLVDAVNAIIKQMIGRISNLQHQSRYDGNKFGPPIYKTALFWFVINLKRKNIKPVFIFDGKPPPEKQNIIKSRRMAKKKAEKKCEILLQQSEYTCDVYEDPEYIKQQKRCVTLSSSEIDDCIRMLEIIGIPAIKAEGEADALLAAMSRVYATDYGDKFAGVMTGDADILVYGGTTIIRDFSMKNCTSTEISLSSIYTFLKIKANNIRQEHGLASFDSFVHNNFIEFVTLMGTDYKASEEDYVVNESGKNRSLKITGCSNAQKHETLFELYVVNNMDLNKMVDTMVAENTTLDHPKYIIPLDFLSNIAKIKSVYTSPDVLDPSSIVVFKQMPHGDDLVDMLRRDGFDDKSIREITSVYDIKTKKLQPYFNRRQYTDTYIAATRHTY